MTMANFTNPLSDIKYTSRLEKRTEDIRGPYFRDQTAVIHSFPFRRLKHKAQVFFSPNNDHVCTRIEHAFHVATIAATIARALGLNYELAYAIGLAHDLGHAPFGHSGEEVLRKKTNAIGGFIHEIHGLRVVDKLGNRGKGLNLTYAVRDGIICHCGEAPDQRIKPRSESISLESICSRNIFPSSYEGCIVRMSDKIAYLGRDLEDALYGGFITRDQVPQIIDKELGTTNGEIIDSLVIDVINNSKETGEISLSNSKYEVMQNLYNFSRESIYRHEAINRYRSYCEKLLESIFDYLIELYMKWNNNYEKYQDSPVLLDNRFGRYLFSMSQLYQAEKASALHIVRDYTAGMTDGYALKCMKEISFPEELNFDIDISNPLRRKK